ncbi:putative caspase-like protein [Kitasatospora gansuensis]|uniref:Putative caspase-like protein n=1 Tax=Kitasatospora gansuensis TaxID=258050 RepID=A0A7W7SA70_9ACTN|nr:putative caspase-like protein [Kitasatospora gansuensis]
MTELSDPARSQAVLVGVHGYRNLENLPAVAYNLAGLKGVLTDPAVWGLPGEACTVISQPTSAGQVLDTVRERAREARDTLLIYYAGHGLTDPHTDELYLALPDSDREREYTSLRYEYLRRAVLDPQARAQRTVVILDCCYSGRALVGKMGAGAQIADRAVVEGTCLLTASAETRPALSPPDEQYTAFTGELITTLAEGVPGGPDLLDMGFLYRHLHSVLAAKSRPLPQQRNRNAGGLIVIARNRARTPVVRPSPTLDLASPLSPQSEPAVWLAELEKHAEQVRQEAEQVRLETETRVREMVQTAQGIANAMAAEPDPDFKPVWFAVPEKRPLLGQDGSLTPLAELVPGVWYLALEQRGGAFLAQIPDGRRGLLLDTGWIQRGDSAPEAPVDALPVFDAFWFAVPRRRALLALNGELTTAAVLAPGVWHLAVEQRKEGLLVRTQDGRIGLLRDTEELERAGSTVAEEMVERTLRRVQRLAGAVLAQPEPDFEPFWFAVPEVRPLLGQDGSLAQVAQLEVGVWHLAVERRGEAFLVRTQDGRRGLLLDTTGIQRG